jgi:SAM-dependent methyltransferase
MAFLITILVLVITTTFFCFFLSVGVFYGGLYSAPYVPSSKKTLTKLIDMANLKPNQKIYDLGCGDGRIVFAAADKGAIAVGIEVSYIIYCWARFKKWLFKRKGTIIHSNIFNYNLSDADVVFCYLLPRAMPKLQQKLNQELKSGCLVVSHAFQLTDWPIIKKSEYNRQQKIGSVWVYQKK